MMPNFAVVDSKGLIVNMALWDGESEWKPGEGLTAIEAQDSWMIGGSIIDEKYTAPELPALSDDEMKASNSRMKASLMEMASGKIYVLQDAVDLDMATEEESSKLTEWKKYRVTLNRIDANTPKDISWPSLPS